MLARRLYACGQCGALVRVINGEGGRVRGQCTRSSCGAMAADVTSLEWFLKTRCASHVLWARDAAHLAQLKAIVVGGADRPHVGGMQNGCRCCRGRGSAPRWVLEAANRPLVLRAIEVLEAKMNGFT